MAKLIILSECGTDYKSAPAKGTSKYDLA